jgi:UDPglucose 6-dehydrogenase
VKIAIVGTGYVGLSNGILLSQHHEVVELDIIPEKVAMLNRNESPVIDVVLEDYLHHKPLNFRVTLEKRAPVAALITSSLPRPPTTIHKHITLIPGRLKA